MNETNVAVEPTGEPEKKRPGNPNWQKKSADPVKKADIVSENAIADIWEVHGKDPKMHYVWARKSSDEEMNRMLQRQYVPARGKERIMGNPLESNKCGEGETKERGDRILMMCPKHLVQARRLENANKHVNAEKSAKADARAMSRHGVNVESVTTSETRRESLNED